MFLGVVLMESDCRKSLRRGVLCPAAHSPTTLGEPAGVASAPGHSPSDATSPSGIAFGAASHAQLTLEGRVPIPGYDAPGLPLKPLRDPSLSLIALSGVDPSGPVMVEVPVVQNNSAFTADQGLGGRRIGFAERFVLGLQHEPIEHSRFFLAALGILRRAGAQLVPVPAHRANDTLRSRNEIDELVHEYRLDALVSDSQSAAFHGACWSGYPRLAETLEDGATLWFYGARWSKDSLSALAQGYRSARRLMDQQDGLPGALSNPTW